MLLIVLVHPKIVWYLGLLAIAKLLSPSHSKESISLYKAYTQFLKDHSLSGAQNSALSQKLLKNGINGFQFNRFGQIGELSTALLNHKPLLDKFFDEVVDEYANKLVLTVYAYKESQWVNICCEVAAHFYRIVTLPLKEIIGIDQRVRVRE